jgi:TonB family protein
VVVREEAVAVQGARAPGAAPRETGARNTPRREQDVRRVLASRRGQFQYCYASTFERLHRAGGTVALTFTVRPSGEVAEIALDDKASTLHDSALASCLTARMRTWRFPRIQGGATQVRARWRFSPGHPR